MKPYFYTKVFGYSDDVLQIESDTFCIHADFEGYKKV